MKNTTCSELLLELNEKRKKVRYTILLFIFYIVCHFFKLNVSVFDFAVFIENNTVVLNNPSFLHNGFPQIMIWSIIQNLDETLNVVEGFLAQFGKNIYDVEGLHPANVGLTIAPSGQGKSFFNKKSK